MRKQRRKHTQEFKREAVGLVVDHGYSCAAAGRSLGVNGAMVGRWKNELESDAAEAFQGQGKRTAEQQRIHDLETENRRLRMEKEILKKAAVSSSLQCNTIIQCISWRSMSIRRPGR